MEKKEEEKKKPKPRQECKKSQLGCADFHQVS